MLKSRPMGIFDQILDLLNKNSVEYELFEHEPVRTSEDASKVRGTALKEAAKSMLVKVNSGYFLLVLRADKKINWKKAKELLNAKKIRFATDSEAEEVTGSKPGSLNPFGNLIGIETYFDTHLSNSKYLFLNPGSVEHTIKIRTKDLFRLVKPKTANIT